MNQTMRLYSAVKSYQDLKILSPFHLSFHGFVMNYAKCRWEFTQHPRLRMNWKWPKESTYRQQLDFQLQSLLSQSYWIGICWTLQKTWSHCWIGSVSSYQVNWGKKPLNSLRKEKPSPYHNLYKLCHMSSALDTWYAHNFTLVFCTLLHCNFVYNSRSYI